MRRRLYMAALTASRYKPVVQGFYTLLRQAGKTPMSALAAAMVKLMHIGVLHRQTPFQIQPVGGWVRIGEKASTGGAVQVGPLPSGLAFRRAQVVSGQNGVSEVPRLCCNAHCCSSLAGIRQIIINIAIQDGGALECVPPAPHIWKLKWIVSAETYAGEPPDAGQEAG